MHPKMAEKYSPFVHTNGIVNTNKANSLYKLLEAFKSEKKGKVTFNISPKDVENIFNLATAGNLSANNGEFRTKFIDDIVKLKSCGVDDIKFAMNLSAIINMSDAELKTRLNGNVRNDVITRFEALSDDIKSELEKHGLNIEFLKSKSSQKPLDGRKIDTENKAQSATVRKLDDIVGTERVVLNKFKSEIPEEVWSNPESFRKWTEDKLKSVLDFSKNPNYTAEGNYAEYNQKRVEGVENWYKYLTTQSNFKDDIYAHLIIMDGITKEFKKDNAAVPPAISEECAEKIYNDILAGNTKVSFSRDYAKSLREKAIKKYTKSTGTDNGIEGIWVTIPQSKKGDALYDEHIAMVQALSEGSSWCLRFDNAHTYLQGGNLHFFVDSEGRSQVAINETNGKITQIQKRYNQDSTVPVAYSKIISDWKTENKYSGLESKISDALNAKPKFDKLKEDVTQYMKEKNYAKVFDAIGIKYTIANDGTFIIKDYCAKLDGCRYTIHELGINENELMKNVSIIDNISLDGSNLTELTNVKEINNVTLGDAPPPICPELVKLNGKTIHWE